MATAEDRVSVANLSVATVLHRFVAEELLSDLDIEPKHFWQGFADLVNDFGPRNRALLNRRDELQIAIDSWHQHHPYENFESTDYRAFLEETNYIETEGDDFSIDTDHVDDEIAHIPGPQLVVPITNARYSLNAANARWGSLYDAIYGTDVLGTDPPDGPYDSERGGRVIAWARTFLDKVVPLASGSHAEVERYTIANGQLTAELPDKNNLELHDATQFVGFNGEPSDPSSILLEVNSLHLELVIDRTHDIGSNDRAGIADIVLESAITSIMDCEDSVSTVDAADKVLAYRNWLGLNRGDLTAQVTKDGRTFIRKLENDRTFRSPDGGSFTLPGRALMLIRNVGHLTSTDAVLDQNGDEIPEGLLDAMITVAGSMADLTKSDSPRNSRLGSIYVVKPKMHGSAEVAFTNDVFSQVENVLGLPNNTVKLGIMDEERRTTLNLKECIRAAQSRVAFINTGFLDRTGDEIHTSMEAGPMVRKADMRAEQWITAYEDWNVDIGIACGLLGRAQIGKGMWAAPNQMAKMLREKINHPQSGANCAWVPSPTAATLHATHYFHENVITKQAEIAEGGRRAQIDDLIQIPVSPHTDWSDDEIIAELENNAQGILGYTVRWIDQGIGCSTVPDIHDVGLMEDRATCRISSQHIANWLHHGVVDEMTVRTVFERMAVTVDRQNETDELYTPMSPDFDGHAFLAALALVFEGREQPSGYTEPILHERRRMRKAEIHQAN